MSEHRQPLVRAATADDAPAVAAAHVAAWRAAYAGVMRQEFLDGLDVNRFEANWRTALTREDPPSVLVGELAGEVVGFAMVRPEQARGDAAAEPGRGELAAINVHPAAWGTGAGTALLDAAERTLAQQGFPRAVLWVAAQNPRARRFYERQGWTHDGVDTVDEIGGPVPTTRYSKSLP